MNEFDTNPSEPFTLKEGNTITIATYNRIAALNRVNYLVQQKIVDFDIRQKSEEYKNNLDKEMYARFYINDSDAKIGEEFCQRIAEICLEMEIDDEIAIVREEIDEKNSIAVIPKPKKSLWQRFYAFINLHNFDSKTMTTNKK